MYLNTFQCRTAQTGAGLFDLAIAETIPRSPHMDEKPRTATHRFFGSLYLSDDHRQRMEDLRRRLGQRRGRDAPAYFAAMYLLTAKGVTFLVTDSSGAVVGNSNGEFISGEDGRIVIDGVAPGTTVIAREIKTPDGVVLDSTPKTIKIGDTGGKDANILRFYNKETGYLVVRKLDKISKEPLSGVEFELTYAQGGYVDDNFGHLSSKGRFKTNDLTFEELDAFTEQIEVQYRDGWGEAFELLNIPAGEEAVFLRLWHDEISFLTGGHSDRQIEQEREHKMQRQKQSAKSSIKVQLAQKKDSGERPNTQAKGREER